jgi:hypothetical protein
MASCYAPALEDARERLEAKSRQVKMLNAAVRNNT